MVTTLARSHVEGFLTALASRDCVRIAPFLDENVDWLLVGPVELFPFCGQRIGKAAVLATYQQMSTLHSMLSVVREHLLVDGDCASALTRMTLSMRRTGREGQLRVAQFVRFRNNLVVDYCAVIDSLAAAEQALGHALDLSESVPAEEVA